MNLIFVGLPFSGSSAISKELMTNYGGKPLLGKHANLPILFNSDKKFRSYRTFLVLRDPVEICFTIYKKLLSNPNNLYTDPKYLRGNPGGFIPKKRIKEFEDVNNNLLSFNQYLSKYKKLPYDNAFTINAKLVDHVIRFSTIQDSFEQLMVDTGTTPKRKLPIYNKTPEIKALDKIDVAPDLLLNIFGPYYTFHQKHFPDVALKPSLKNMLLFKALIPVRKYRLLQRDKYEDNRLDSVFGKH